MTSYIFIEKFGHGRAASRNLRVNEIEIADDDGWTFRVEVLAGHHKDEAAREYFSIGWQAEDLVLCKTDAAQTSNYWLETSDPDLWVESDAGDMTYRINDHAYAMIPQA